MSLGLDGGTDGPGGSEQEGPLKLANQSGFTPGNVGQRDNTTCPLEEQITLPTGDFGTTNEKQWFICERDTFNNFAYDIPSQCAPPIVPRLGKSGGKSFPFKPVSNPE